MQIKLRRGQKEFKCPKCSEDLEIIHGRFDSNAKGSAFESFIAREMSIIMYDDPKALRRTPTSGAMANFWPYDVYPAKPGTQSFPYAIECKHRNGWRLEDLLNGKTSVPKNKRKADQFILDWWNTLKEDINKYKSEYGDKIPILAIKSNRRKPLVLLPTFYLLTEGELDLPSLRADNDICIITWENFKLFLEDIKNGSS